MTVYYVDDGGDGSDGSTWAKAYTSLSALDDAITLASGDIVYIGHNHVCQFTHSGNRTITGPTSGLPCIIISATQGSSPPTYAASITNQIDTSEGAYTLTFDGSLVLYGVKTNTGAEPVFSADDNESMSLYNVTLSLAANGYVKFTSGASIINNLTIDLTNDGTTNRSNYVLYQNGGSSYIKGLSFVNAAYRTGTVITGSYNTGDFYISEADFSGFTNGTLCELINQSGSAGSNYLNNCKTASTWAPTSAQTTSYSGKCFLINVGPDNQKTYLYYMDKFGLVVSTTSIYRTGGATVESTAVSWLVTTTANACEGYPFTTPYIYGSIASTGSKTFDLYITNDSADLTDAECWLEVEYLGTTSEGKWSLATDQRAGITTTAANQTDDTTSTWNGTGPSFTYKQKLSLTATVNVAGLYRARVCVGKASIASSAYFYIDPKITVS